MDGTSVVIAPADQVAAVDRPPALCGGRGWDGAVDRWPLVLLAVGDRPPPVGKELGERVLGGLAPADAERVSGRVGVHLVALIGEGIPRRLEQTGAQCEDGVTCTTEVVDM